MKKSKTDIHTETKTLRRRWWRWAERRPSCRIEADILAGVPGNLQGAGHTDLRVPAPWLGLFLMFSKH